MNRAEAARQRPPARPRQRSPTQLYCECASSTPRALSGAGQRTRPPFSSEPPWVELPHPGRSKTELAQKDAIPGTRFGHLVDSHLWDVAVARNYVFQFAAYASDNDALSPEGMLAGARAFQNMTPDAKLFTQVASVFKGDINGGPGFYDNPGLKKLLESRGLFDLANQPLVGETDVQTIGAITKAINRGALSLNDILNSGTIDNMPRYQQLINYVSSGGFAQDVHRYDSSPF